MRVGQHLACMSSHASRTIRTGTPALSDEQLAQLRALRAFLIDLDGVVYTGNRPIEGAREFFQFLTGSGRRFQCITNNSTLTAEQFAAKLGAMDVDVQPEQVL